MFKIGPCIKNVWRNKIIRIYVRQWCWYNSLRAMYCKLLGNLKAILINYLWNMYVLLLEIAVLANIQIRDIGNTKMYLYTRFCQSKNSWFVFSLSRSESWRRKANSQKWWYWLIFLTEFLYGFPLLSVFEFYFSWVSL